MHTSLKLRLRCGTRTLLQHSRNSFFCGERKEKRSRRLRGQRHRASPLRALRAWLRADAWQLPHKQRGRCRTLLCWGLTGASVSRALGSNEQRCQHAAGDSRVNPDCAPRRHASRAGVASAVFVDVCTSAAGAAGGRRRQRCVGGEKASGRAHGLAVRRHRQTRQHWAAGHLGSRGNCARWCWRTRACVSEQGQKG